VDADDAGVFLVEDGVDRHGGLAGLAVADDQLALASTDRHHRVDGFQAGLERLLHPLPIHNSGRDTFDGRKLCRGNRSLAVERLTERVDDTSKQPLANRNRNNSSGPLDGVALFDFLEFTQQHGADALLFEVERDAKHAVRELEHLAGHRILDAVHTRDAVANRDDAADFGHIDVDGEAPDLIADDLGYLFGLDVHLLHPGRG